MSEIWAVLEHREGTFPENSGELLAELADIAQRQQHPTMSCAVVLASPDTLYDSHNVVARLAPARSLVPSEPDKSPDSTPLDTATTTLLSTSGVQCLYLLEHPQLAHYTTEGYVSALAWLLQQHTPALLVSGATANGRDCVPRLAARLHLPFAANCLGLDLHDDALFALRAIYEGRAYIQTRTALHGHTALATLLAGVRGIPVRTRDTASQLPSPAITRLTPQVVVPRFIAGNSLQRLAIQAPSAEEIELEAAERIVAGGRGIGREGFSNVAAFARLLGAAVGATRVATDQGWIEHARQIGATGKSVRPKLYIACGISGAAQHISGISEAQTVVAINPDRSAPIFALADLGLLGDANKILPLAAEISASIG